MYGIYVFLVTFTSVLSGPLCASDCMAFLYHCHYLPSLTTFRRGRAGAATEVAILKVEIKADCVSLS